MKRIFRYVFMFSLLLFLIGAAGLTYLYVQHPEVVFKQVNKVPVQEEKRFDASKVKGLEISTDTVDISIVPGTGQEVIVSLLGEISGTRKSGLRFQTELTKEQLLKVDLEQQFQFGIELGIASRLDLQVMVPPKLYEQLQLNTSTGDIELNGVEAKTVIVESSTGNINVGSTKGEDVAITTNTGDIEITKTQAKLNVRSDTGDIILTEKLSQDVTINTSTGDVLIVLSAVPEAFRIDAESSTGDIDVEMAAKLDEKRTENSYFGTKGSNGPLVEIRSTTGNIGISQKNEQAH